jgi:hypothetical protein
MKLFGVVVNLPGMTSLLSMVLATCGKVVDVIPDVSDVAAMTLFPSFPVTI